MFAILRCIKLNPISGMKWQTRKKSLYNRGFRFFFKENLLLTNSITSGAFMAIGDLVQQEIEYQRKFLSSRYDWGRLGRMFLVGTLLGPPHHYYYVYLDKFIPQVNLKTVTLKIALDQLVCAPITLVCFFYGMALLEEKSLSESTQEVKNKFPSAYMGDWIYWPPVQFYNFYYLPIHYRLVYINGATMIFNIFLSYMKHYDQH